MSKQKHESSFEDQLAEAVRKRVLAQIAEAKFVEPYRQRTNKIPDEIVERVWDNVDWDEVVKTVSKNLTERVAATITQAMLTEAKTDAKAVLSIEGVRAKLRATAYPKVIEAIGDN